MRKIDLDEIKAFMANQGPATRVYFGCDSVRYRSQGVWYAEYSAVAVVHMDSCHGAKIFGEVTTERDYDQRKDRPSMRLMNEVYKVSELFIRLKDVLQDFEVEIHLDISSNKMHGSSCAVQQAIGYIRGTCNVIPLVKPDAWAASFGADRFTSLALAKSSAKCG